MIKLVLFIGMLNVMLGYALGIYVDGRPAAAARARTRKKRARGSGDIKPAGGEVTTVQEEAFRHETPAAPAEEIPEEWLETLEEVGETAKSFVEASIQVLKLEVGRYRATMLEMEDRVRLCRDNPNAEELERIVAELKDVNVDWLGKQNDAVEHMQARADNLGSFAETGSRLEDVLLDQAAQIETTCSNFDIMDFTENIDEGCKRLIVEVCRLIDLAHSLRDRMQDSMLAIMVADNRLDGLDRKHQFDGSTSLHNRVGLEVIFKDWWAEDAVRERTVSIAFIDVDHFAKINAKHGTKNGDLLIGAFGRVIADMTRNDRGFDVPIRFAGQTFAIFYGDTGPRSAMAAIERIRQTIDASTFEYDGFVVEPTVSCGVVEVGKKETTGQLFKRLQKTLRHAKKGGRNATAIDEGEGPTSVNPPEYNVKARVVHVY